MIIQFFTNEAVGIAKYTKSMKIILLHAQACESSLLHKAVHSTIHEVF